MTKHTPTPWSVAKRERDNKNPASIGNTDIFGTHTVAALCPRYGLAVHGGTWEADSALIVHRVNTYEQLVEALRECMKDTFTAARGMEQGGDPEPKRRYRMAVEALRAAEETDNA